MRKKKFAAVAFNPKHKTYVVHVASFGSTPLNVHLFCKSQISGLIAKKAPTKVFKKYANFANIFSPDLASKLPKHIGINDHTMKLVDGQQPPYWPIYCLKPVKLETLKAFIETNLANSFIRLFKSPASALILFN